MSDQSPEDRAANGKRLLLYGMFALVVVTVVAVFVTLYVIAAPFIPSAGDVLSLALQTTLIVGVIAVIACVIAWFVYTKLILKE